MIVQAMNSDKSKSLKYKMFTPSGYKYIEIRKLVAKTQFLYECDLNMLIKFFNPLKFRLKQCRKLEFDVLLCNHDSCGQLHSSHPNPILPIFVLSTID